MFISKIVVILFAVLVGSALAAPVRIERSLDDVQLSPRGVLKVPHSREAINRSHRSQAMKVFLKINQKLKPKPGKSVFWTGKVPKNGNPEAVTIQPDAEHWAAVRNKEAIDPMLKKKGVNMPSRDDNRYAGALWKHASRVFAHRASGHVHTLLGSVIRKNAIYKNIEKPILMQNNKVTRLTEHDVLTGTKTVVNDSRVVLSQGRNNVFEGSNEENKNKKRRGGRSMMQARREKQTRENMMFRQTRVRRSGAIWREEP
ncbi:hypothetical protein M413DRAFT_14879 [Hebeloma cylindrosporum]|uniref:Uncharacterized protein n=1 Tax=Hebeloma cylindrosporum TaxID=76867 RepID=A0A0C2Y167_HEBCY|nr:hypothetical protein M413DRAFT_14879 [Hebeloma cylindrosporum h7]